MDNIEIYLRKIRIGSPGKFDSTFGLKKSHHPMLMEPLYVVVWLDTGHLVDGIGSFFDGISAENYIKENRQKLIDKEFERILLINK